MLESRSGAHSGYYLQYLVSHWSAGRGAAHELVLVLPPSFARDHPEALAELRVAETGGHGIRVAEVPAREWRRTERLPGPLAALARLPGVRRRLRLRVLYLRQWLVLRRQLDRLRPDRALAMSLDDLLLPAVLFPPRHGIELAGILFKPSFHYRRFAADERKTGARVRGRLELALLRLFLRRRGARVLTLDPWAAEELRASFGDKATVLPEPSRGASPDPAHLRHFAERLGIEPSRQVFLLLGMLDDRRGLPEVLAALEHLGEADARRVCLLLAGLIEPRRRGAALASIERLRRTTACQIVFAEGRIAETQLPPFFQLADAVLVTHRHHVGSSGNLLHAAAAGRPVIATRDGLIGQQVRVHRLGVGVDASTPAEIAAGIRSVLDRSIDELFDREAAARLAAANTPEQYAAALTRALTGEDESR